MITHRGTPEGQLPAPIGAECLDVETGDRWGKFRDGGGTTGWQRMAPAVPGAWPQGDEGAPDGAVRCVDCDGGLEHLGRGLEHLERTGHDGVTFVGGTDRVWSVVPMDLPVADQLQRLRAERGRLERNQ